MLAFAAASLLAAYSYGRFAERARGAPSAALPRIEDATALDRRIGAMTAGREGESGLVMLASNLDAFAARALAARNAGRSLDLMYYIWQRDLTGRLLLGEVIAAADRGVRVRLLLDDIGVGGGDATLLALATHPGIEVRLFNPTRARRSALRRGIEMLLRAYSVTRRMHNKAWIADGRVAITGGRNVGDEYFDAAEASNFRDVDVLAFGQVVDQTEAMFDAFWNSEVALPVAALARGSASLAQLRQQLADLADGEQVQPYLARVREHSTLLELVRDRLHWTTTARLLADPPEKALTQKGDNWLGRELFPLILAARDSVEISSPYFVPGEAGTNALLALAARGVAVSVLTNSLAATDVAAVHGGYAPYRKPLLRGGVALYELRPVSGAVDLSLRGSSNASLHTKAFTVDGRTGFVGSLNFDPRSTSLNTEMGIVFEVPALLAELRALFAAETAPESSYALGLDERGDLLWRANGEDGVAAEWASEPHASVLRRAIARLVGWLPLESQL